MNPKTSAQAATRAARCARRTRRAFLTSALAPFAAGASLAISEILHAQSQDHDSGKEQPGAEDHAQSDNSDEPVFDLSEGITPPKVIHQVSPKPDSGAGGFRITGVVLIGLVVSSQGLPVRVRVVKSVDKEVDQSAMEAVRQWRFEPARKGDKPVAVRLTIEIRFHDV
jgi:TonB family protein